MDKIYELAYVPDWQSNLDQLEELSIKEDWSYKEYNSNKNGKNPILHQYINHTIGRLLDEREQEDSIELKQKVLYIDDNIFCFNTGLYTNEYQEIFGYMEKNKNQDRQEWFFVKFLKSTSVEISNIFPKPRRAKYFNDVHELIYDYDLTLDPQLDHILTDEGNKNRIPESVRGLPLLAQISIFEGAIQLAKKKISANYKVAVPQYYNGGVQFLLPLAIDINSPESIDLVLAVKKIESTTGNYYYKGFTALTMDMAYNNARLLAKIDSDWLRV
ncbi:conserved protein of unknown function [Petrocella atlantisensis]|uniref:DUF3825 domain-containing protein n=1 Tax=Petrocella atlantisensis TaxID=2173034 RepID=A0A3P7PTY3_9FIRM|nr:DUF3825 domain-containing protein [Petrocella atlantisensis]VDN46701.1 conserved protein of unknown function [Petrocella atlantisensis]